jgi:hypothetical protein
VSLAGVAIGLFLRIRHVFSRELTPVSVERAPEA